jgi:hypothetical protein
MNLKKTKVIALAIGALLLLSATAMFVHADSESLSGVISQQTITPGKHSFEFVNGTTAFTTYASYKGTVDYVANGTSMRNWGTGTITISGVPDGFPKPYGAHPLVRVALLYWSVMNDTYSPSLAQGKFNGVPITGTLLGNDDSPCWSPLYIFGFRADVTNLVLPGINGLYNLTDFASGITDGTNPWIAATPPLLEGASLVIVYHHPTITPTHTVMIYDGPPVTFAEATVNTTISGFRVGKTVDAKTTFIISDGQIQGVGVGTKSAWLQSPAGDILLGTAFDGQDVVDSTGSSNTVTGWLHDTSTFALSPYFAMGTTTSTLAVKTGNDCLTWLAQVFSANIS